MNGQLNVTGALIRSIVLVAGVAALALLAVRPAAASQDYDPTVAANVQASMCRAAGGTAVVEVTRKVSGAGVTVTCTGGILDGWSCVYIMDMTVCTDPSSRTEDLPELAPASEVEAAAQQTAPAIVTTVDAVSPTDGADPEREPAIPTTEVVEDGAAPAAEDGTGETEVTAMRGIEGDGVTPADGAVDPIAEEQVAESQQPYNPTVGAGVQMSMCEAAGGTYTVDVYRTVGGGVYAVHVRCFGGALGGWGCTHYADRSDCGEPPQSRPEDAPPPAENAVEPTDGVDVEDVPVTTPDTVDEAVDPTVLDEDETEPGQNLPENPALEETTPPTDSGATADPGDNTNATHVLAGENAVVIFVEMDEEQG